MYWRSGNPTNVGGSGVWNGWREIIHSGNIGSQSVNYAITAGSATNATYSNVATCIADNAIGLRIENPQGASYVAPTGSVTGAIKITLPAFRSNTMIRFTVKIYEYSRGMSRDIVVAGYNHYLGNWDSLSAYQSTQYAGALIVRFGYENDKNVVWIGETTSTWTYPQVFVTDFQAAYSNYLTSQWLNNWGITFATAFGTVEDSVIAYFNYSPNNCNNSSTDWISKNMSVNGLLQAYRYPSAINLPAITLDKPGTSSFGIGPDGTNMRVRYGTAPIDGSTWNLTGANGIEHYFDGNMVVNNRISAYSNGGGGGYISDGNWQGTGQASWHPCGIYSAGTNWLYGNCAFNSTLNDSTGTKWAIRADGSCYFTGYSTSWGVGYTSTGVLVNMGTSTSATWLVGGISGGTFRGGIQLLDSGSHMCLYANTNYLMLDPNGIYFNGTKVMLNEEYSDLSSNTWDTSTGLKKRKTGISSNFTLTISNLVNGMQGDLRLLFVSGGITITLSVPQASNVQGNGSLANLSMGYYHFCWTYDGSGFDWNIAKYA